MNVKIVLVGFILACSVACGNAFAGKNGDNVVVVKGNEFKNDVDGCVIAKGAWALFEHDTDKKIPITFKGGETGEVGWDAFDNLPTVGDLGESQKDSCKINVSLQDVGRRNIL